MRKKYWIKYKMNLRFSDFNGPWDWEWKNRYKTEKARNDALSDMKRKGHKIITTDQG